MTNSDKLSCLINSIYDAATDVDLWPSVVGRVLDATGAVSGGLHLYSFRNQNHVGIVPRTDPMWMKEFQTRWAGRERLLEITAQVPVGKVWNSETLVSRAHLEKLPFYNEFLCPQGEQMGQGASLFCTSEGVGYFAGFRGKSRGPFEGRDASILAVLAPHLSRALRLRVRLAGLESERNGAEAALNQMHQSAMLVSSDARLCFANKAAEALLAVSDGLRLENGRLAARRSDETTSLRLLVAGGKNIDGSSQLALTRLGNRPPLTVVVRMLTGSLNSMWVAPGNPSAIVFTNDPERLYRPPPTRHLSLLFGLTQAQAALALELTCADGGLRVAAERLGITYGTARCHLAAVFYKTGVKKQADLVRLLMKHSLGV